jgi:pimeloyl-ACP methyl ester carboxylesterase
VTESRVHRVVAPDGTEIAGEVRGQGSALVLVHGGLGDGNPVMNMLLPFLANRFTCFLVYTRGRGLSADNPDHSRERQYEDVATFVDSIGEPAGLFGHSSGGTWALGAASRSRACRRLALYEPALPVGRPVITDDQYERFCEAISAGQPAEAARMSIEDVVEPTAEERALFATPGVAELTEPVLPAVVRELPELNRPLDVASIDQVTVPVLLLHGSCSGTHFKTAIQDLHKRLRDSDVKEVPEAGHLGPMTHPNPVATELLRFFSG